MSGGCRVRDLVPLDWRLLDNYVALSVFWIQAVAVCLHSDRWDDLLARRAS